jgi:hypothetical protein
MEDAAQCNIGGTKAVHQALQFDIRAGQYPTAGEHGHYFFHVPLKVPEDAWTWGVGTQE